MDLTYTRKRRIVDDERNSATKKTKDNMEVDNEDNTAELAEVGQS